MTIYIVTQIFHMSTTVSETHRTAYYPYAPCFKSKLYFEVFTLVSLSHATTAAVEKWGIFRAACFRAAYMIYEFERCALNWSPLWSERASALWSQLLIHDKSWDKTFRKILYNLGQMAPQQHQLHAERNMLGREIQQAYTEHTSQTVLFTANSCRRRIIRQLVKTQGMMESFIIYSSPTLIGSLRQIKTSFIYIIDNVHRLQAFSHQK